MASPFWKAQASVGDSNSGLFSYFESKRSLEEQNAVLSSQVIDLQAKLMQFQDLQSQNAALAAELGRKPSAHSQLAAVVLQSRTAPYDSFIIDQGASEGVNIGDLVLAGNSILIGEVSDTYTHESRVELYSQPGNSYDTVFGPSHTPVTLTGRGEGVFAASLPPSLPAAVGDQFSSADNAYSVATIGSVDDDPASVSRTVLARADVNLTTLSYVFVQTQ